MLNLLNLAKLVLLIFCIPLALQAQTSDDWWQRTQSLADNERWLDLIHYEASWFGGHNSYIDDSTFFLSEEGASDPAAELKATIEAFIEKPETQCKYVARKLFLRDISDIDFICRK